MLGAVASHAGEWLREGTQGGHGAIRTILLYEPECGVQQDDRHDGEHILRIANEAGDQRCHQEHNNHRVAELREQHAERTAAACMLQHVGAVLHGAGANDVGGEPLVGGAPKDREGLFHRRGMPGRFLRARMV